MKFKIAVLGSLLLPLMSSICVAEAGKLGMGLLVGEPTGFSAKYWLSDKAAVDGGLALHYGYHDHYYCDGDYYRRYGYYDGPCSDRRLRFQMHGDFLWHFDLPANLPGRLPFNFGLGARLITPYTEVGLRIPLGISYLFDNLPLDIFAELAPVFVFAPYTGGDLDGGVGARFYFGGPPTSTSAPTRRSRRSRG